MLDFGMIPSTTIESDEPISENLVGEVLGYPTRDLTKESSITNNILEIEDTFDGSTSYHYQNLNELTLQDKIALRDRLDDEIFLELKSSKTNVKRKRSHMSTLTDADVIAIHEDRRPLQQIATQYGVSMMTVSNIKLGKTWKHLGLQPCASRRRKSIDKFLSKQEVSND